MINTDGVQGVTIQIDRENFVCSLEFELRGDIIKELDGLGASQTGRRLHRFS